MNKNAMGNDPICVLPGLWRGMTMRRWLGVEFIHCPAPSTLPGQGEKSGLAWDEEPQGSSGTHVREKKGYLGALIKGKWHLKLIEKGKP